MATTDIPTCPCTIDTPSPAATEWAPPSSVIVATDGSTASDAAVVLGRALARRDMREPELITVFERMQMAHTPSVAGLSDLAIDLGAKQAWWHEIEEQRRRIAPTARRWPVTFAEGRAARRIAAFANAHPNPFVLMGLGEHGILERTLGRELALDVIREGVAPVLAVHPDQITMPRRILAAVDFSAASLEAARLALHLLGDAGTLYVVRVRETAPEGDGAPWEAPTEEEEERYLSEDVRRLLAAPAGVTLETALLRGDPVLAILRFAMAHEVDLIACGMHRYTALERLLVGSVSTRVLRSAPCSVLVAPPPV